MRYYTLILMLLSPLLFAKTEKNPVFKSKISTIPWSIASEMRQYTWNPRCPVPLEQLAYVQLSYWGFDNQPHLGALIVHKDLAQEVSAIFKILYEHQFPIQRMDLMDVFQGDDEASMAANNTSAFNCREVTDRPGEFSQHSYGRAIDINPLINPYVHGKKILPPEGAHYVDRKIPALGKITKGDIVYQAFTSHGWDWAGNWHDIKDFQHFEKRAHGKKRNPHGYGVTR